MATFGARLAALRKKQGLSQAVLAKQLRIAKSTLAMYETNKREPSFETLWMLAEHFHVSLDYLLGRPDLDHSGEPPAGEAQLVLYDGHIEKLSSEEAFHLEESLELYRILQEKRQHSPSKDRSKNQ